MTFLRACREQRLASLYSSTRLVRRAAGSLLFDGEFRFPSDPVPCNFAAGGRGVRSDAIFITHGAGVDMPVQ